MRGGHSKEDGMGTASTADGWHVSRGETPSGPYTWDDLYHAARQGHVIPGDLVWHPAFPQWVSAGTVPGLFAAPPVVAPPPAAPAAPGTIGHADPRAPRRRRIGLVVVLILGVIIIAVAAGAAYMIATANGSGGVADSGAGLVQGGAGGDAGDGSSDTSTTVPALGVVFFPPVEHAKIVATEEWGDVPIDQLGMMLAEDRTPDDAKVVAEALGGTLVGGMEYLNLFLVQVPATSEAELAALLEQARSSEGVLYAFPNQEIVADEDIWGVRESPLVDRVYTGENAKPYHLTGVDRAWSTIKGSEPSLSPVHVGIVDDGLFRAQGEFNGTTKIRLPETDDRLITRQAGLDRNPKPYGSHGTGVAGIIAANPDNGGQVGVASVLGDKLTIGMTNMYGAVYGTDSPATPDPTDPTQYTEQGQTFSLGALQAIKKQLDDGATIINLSWGATDTTPALAAVYRAFFEKMSREHPEILFVCSAGNNGRAIDGTRRFPGGLALPNMITVGNVNNDGTPTKSSNLQGGNFEVTLAAPGNSVVSGVAKDGTVGNRNGGTSFATPQVTAAAAIIRSLNPGLSAAEIKEILVKAAGEGAAGTPDDPLSGTAGTSSPGPAAPKGLGAGILRVDKAILKVMNDLRAQKGEPSLSEDAAAGLGAIDAVATTGEPGEYTIRGIVAAVGSAGTDVEISLNGEGGIGGSTRSHLDGPGEATWYVTLATDMGTVIVRRLDNGAASVITLDTIDLNGHWVGSLTVGSVTMPPDAGQQAKEEGCDLGLLESLPGQILPMTLDIAADPGGTGTAAVTLDGSKLGQKTSAETGSITWKGSSFTFKLSGQGNTSLTGRASRLGDTLTITGTLISRSQGIGIEGSWTVSRKE